jgi:hypothetical protein
MTKRWWRGVGLLLLASMVLLEGCASGGAYRETGYAGTFTNQVPGALRDTDPALKQWYSAPYFNPYEMP